MTDVLGSVSVATRFAGPPSSGNGGFSAGLLAEHTPTRRDAPITVTLRHPPPLETPLQVVPDPEAPDVVRLVDGDVVVAEAGPGDFTHDVVPPVAIGAALVAQTAYRGLVVHPFPGCFVCGTARADGDGLRLQPGPTSAGQTACVWTPEDALALGQDEVAIRFVWSALDCPGGWTSDLDARPLVLGRMTTRRDAPVLPGRPHVIVARLLGEDGRKTFTASAMYDEGRLVARAEHVWIAVDPARFA
jgi:hypothetical protein